MRSVAKPRLTLVSHHLCPYVQRAAIALTEKGVPFERIVIDLAGKPDWFMKISPLGKVPLLIVRQDDGFEAVIFESAVICEYLEETQGGPALHLADPLERAQHRAWIEFGSSILGDLWGFETAKDAATYTAKLEALKEKFARLEATLAEGPFFAGQRFSMVDAVFAPIFRYFDVFEEIGMPSIFGEMPHIMAWRTALASRPSVVGAVSPDYSDRLRDFLRGYDAHLLKLAA